MVKLIYSTIASLDSFVEDRNGAFDWAAPNEEVFAFINQLERPIGTYLYGRRMYETMVYWESFDAEAGHSAVEKEFAEIWKAASKMVYSTTLAATSSGRTTIEREFNVEAILRMKATSSSDISMGGAGLASLALSAGLVDEVQLFVVPVVVGAGKPAFSNVEPVAFDLLEERRFENGSLYLRYAVVK
jgi:dihydrofolate reductase